MAGYCYASLGSLMEKARQHSHGERGLPWSSHPAEGIMHYYEETSKLEASHGEVQAAASS